MSPRNNHVDSGMGWGKLAGPITLATTRSMAKIIIVILLGLVILSLGAGMVTMIKDRQATDRTARFLTLRIGLSILVFVFIGVSFYMGWIQPHGIVPPRP